jgi:hypothetical protein
MSGTDFSELGGIFWLMMGEFRLFGILEWKEMSLFGARLRGFRWDASIAVLLGQLNSNEIAGFRFWVDGHFRIVIHFSRFAFHHQLKGLGKSVSVIARFFGI